MCNRLSKWHRLGWALGWLHRNWLRSRRRHSSRTAIAQCLTHRRVNGKRFGLALNRLGCDRRLRPRRLACRPGRKACLVGRLTRLAIDRDRLHLKRRAVTQDPIAVWAARTTRDAREIATIQLRQRLGDPAPAEIGHLLQCRQRDLREPGLGIATRLDGKQQQTLGWGHPLGLPSTVKFLSGHSDPLCSSPKSRSGARRHHCLRRWKNDRGSGR
ncbi:hypothetical protein Thi970DRAFT_00081 [Thiorhodovibrio frisius]|uniref:Uncharacterized protein n=1 Tax=Thiorhodovibrio frisius TaxID=631362 RepID=H8YVK6_9GAMM|nr:hypothetical protein Thi970DRAFT_00081 [Thiorhodovibrio frisius]WPL23020.1 hypothetical protein Thiofri_03200 [Thiorhodovibrio frisius]